MLNEDSAKFNSAFSATTLSHAFALLAKTASDRKLQISGRILRIFLNMLAVLRFVSISD
jgi:hypothetical protein